MTPPALAAPVRRRPVVGVMLLIIGGTHLALGLVSGHAAFAGMLADGLVGSLVTPTGVASESFERQRSGSRSQLSAC